jgi:hypothetical protein
MDGDHAPGRWLSRRGLVQCCGSGNVIYLGTRNSPRERFIALRTAMQWRAFKEVCKRTRETRQVSSSFSICSAGPRIPSLKSAPGAESSLVAGSAVSEAVLSRAASLQSSGASKSSVSGLVIAVRVWSEGSRFSLPLPVLDWRAWRGASSACRKI